MDIIQYLWISLTVFAFIIGIIPIRLFIKDKDQNKLMYGLGLILSSLSFLVLGLGYVNYGKYNTIADIIYHWGGIVYLILILHMTLDRLFYKNSDNKKIFYSFIIMLILSFIFIYFQPLDTLGYLLFMLIGMITIFTFCIGLIIIYKNLINYLFLFSILSSLIASINLGQISIENQNASFLSIYAFYMSYIFLGLIFSFGSKETYDQKGIESYFTIKKELKDTKIELKETKRTVTNLFQQMIEPVVIVNLRGTVLEASNKVFEDLGVSKDEIIGKNFLKTNFFDKETKKRLMKNVILRLAGKHIAPYEINVYRKDGTSIPYEIHAGKIHYNGKSVDMAVFRNLTERKKSENKIHAINNELINLNKELETKVEERTRDVKNLLRQKDEFICQLGHDLKNPLNPLVNLLPILQEGEIDVEKKKMFCVINRNVNYMKNLVMNTIELAKLNSPNIKFNYEEISLLDEITGIINNTGILFENKKIKFNVDVPNDIIVSADKFRFKELLNNLIDNSLKYTNTSGKIFIDARIDDDIVTVSIGDTGIGMNQDQISHVFDEFYKADGSRHDFDSSGLGMSICKRIVERHGGKIWVESEGLDKGSTFYFTIKGKNKHLQQNKIKKQKKVNNNNDYYQISKKIDLTINSKF